VVRFGVADSDWFSVLLISCIAYLAPVPFGITLLYVPLQMWTWLLATAGAIAFFNYIRIGRKPYWLQHQLKALFSHRRQYRFIPNSRKSRFDRAWITDQHDNGRSPPRTSVRISSLLLQHNNSLQEACEEKWNNDWATTN
jgi:hypothetical protein